MQRTMLIVAPMFAALLTFAAVRSLAVRMPPQAFISPDNQRVVAKDGTDHLIAIYPIKNQGGKDLVLGDFRTSCGCSSASVDPKILRPGQSGQIRVTGEPPQSGERDVIITLASNSHPHGELKLGLTLVGPEKKIPFVRGNSGPVQFENFRLGSTEKFFIETTERSSEGPWIELAAASFSGLALKLKAVDEQEIPGQGLHRRYRYDATLTKTPPIGEFRDEILFIGKLGDEQGIHRLPVYGKVPEPIVAVPPSIYLNIRHGESLPLLRIQLKGEDTSFPLPSEALIEGTTALTISLKETSSESLLYELTPPSALQETARATVIFRTNHPELAQVRVPVTIVVASP